MSSPLHKPYHAVQFFGEDKTLFDTVAAFLGQGFLEGQPGIIIATSQHAAGILNELQQRMIDVNRARRLGDLVVFDAQRMLETFVEDEIPNATKVEETFGALINSMTQRRGRPPSVRLYGEGVDVLWKQGRYDTAIRLEVLWNDLCHRHAVATLCGYAMRNFLNETMLFEEVCRQHTHVLPARPQA